MLQPQMEQMEQMRMKAFCTFLGDFHIYVSLNKIKVGYNSKYVPFSS